MATHSSMLAWEIPGTENPSGLWPMASLRVGCNLVTDCVCVCTRGRVRARARTHTHTHTHTR